MWPCVLWGSATKAPREAPEQVTGPLPVLPPLPPRISCNHRDVVPPPSSGCPGFTPV